MALQGEYEPSPWDWVHNQVEQYERTGGREANTFMDTGLPIIIVSTRGNKTGKIRKTALMRVEHNGEYALVASMGGAPQNPVWYYNLKADPEAVVIQDGPEPFDATVREISGDEKAECGSARSPRTRLRRVPAEHRTRDPGVHRGAALTRAIRSADRLRRRSR